MLPEEFTTKLAESLRVGGDFPVSATIVEELLAVIKDSPENYSKLASTLLKDPSLGIRLLDMARGDSKSPALKPESLTTAIGSFGVDRLADWVSSLVVVDGFMSPVQFGSSHEKVVTYVMVASLLVVLLGDSLTADAEAMSETYTLLGWCSSFGILAASIYYPNLFTTAVKRMSEKNESLETALHTIIGLSPLEVSIASAAALDLPTDLANALQQSQSLTTAQLTTQGVETPLLPNQDRRAHVIANAARLAETIVFKDRLALGAVLPSVAADLHVNIAAVRNALAHLSAAFNTRCALLGIKSSLPDYLVSYSKGRGGGTFITEQVSLAELYLMKIQELRDSVQRSEATHTILLSVMEFLIWDFGCDRCILMFFDNSKRVLSGFRHLGQRPFTPPDILIPLTTALPPEGSSPEEAILRAVASGQVIVESPPLLPDGCHAVIVPIGYKDRCLGALYADRLTPRKTIGKSDLAMLVNVCDILDESVRRTAEAR